MDELIFQYYSQPQQTGGAYFIGERYNQIGGGFLSNIGRFILPILKTVGKKILGMGAETLNDVVNKDYSVGDSVKRQLVINKDDRFNKRIKHVRKKRTTSFQ